MPADMTIDTNVLVHAQRMAEGHGEAALAFLQKLYACPITRLAIDEGFDLDESKNRSLIGAEYIKYITVGSFPGAVLQHMALTGRINFCATKVDARQSRELNRQVANKRDRTFVRVCCNSEARLLVSHDYDDFPMDVRANIGQLFGIRFTDAIESTDMFEV